MSNFLFILLFLAKHLSKYYVKNENGESFVGRFEEISCVLLPDINILSSKHIRTLIIDPKLLKSQFLSLPEGCYCYSQSCPDMVLKHK